MLNKTLDIHMYMYVYYWKLQYHQLYFLKFLKVLRFHVRHRSEQNVID